MSNERAFQAVMREEILRRFPDVDQTWEGQGRPVKGRWVNVRPIQYPSQLANDRTDASHRRTEPTAASVTLAPDTGQTIAGLLLQGFRFYAETLEGLRDEINLWTEGVTATVSGSTLLLTGLLWELQAVPGSRAIVSNTATEFYERQTQHRVWSVAIETYVAPQPGKVATQGNTNAMSIGRKLHAHFMQRDTLERMASRTIVVLHPLGSINNTSLLEGPQWQSASTFILRCLQTFKEFTTTTPIDSVTPEITAQQG